MKAFNAALTLFLIGSFSSATSMASGFGSTSEVTTTTINYTLDQGTLDACLNSLVADTEKTGVMRCSVELNGPYVEGKFQKYLKTVELQAETGWNCDSLGQDKQSEGSAETDAACKKEGFTVNAFMDINLQNLRITLVIGDPFGGTLIYGQRIQRRQILALRDQLSKRVGQEFEIVYTQKN